MDIKLTTEEMKVVASCMLDVAVAEQAINMLAQLLDSANPGIKEGGLAIINALSILADGAAYNLTMAIHKNTEVGEKMREKEAKAEEEDRDPEVGITEAEVLDLFNKMNKGENN